MNKISSMLDAMADSLESKGYIKEAYEVDKVADKIERSALWSDEEFKQHLTKMFPSHDPTQPQLHGIGWGQYVAVAPNDFNKVRNLLRRLKIPESVAVVTDRAFEYNPNIKEPSLMLSSVPATMKSAVAQLEKELEKIGIKPSSLKKPGQIGYSRPVSYGHKPLQEEKIEKDYRRDPISF